MRFLILVTIVACKTLFCIAQDTKPTTFTIENGLASNTVYRCLEDNKGLLWIATDQGVVRFDGKVFQLFAKEQGVPDIEVFQLVKEKNGRIWIACYNNSVAYFNPEKNRFFDVASITDLLDIHGAKRLTALPDGGIQLDTETGSNLFCEDSSGKQTLVSTHDSTFIIKKNKNGTTLRYRYNQLPGDDAGLDLYLMDGDKILSKRSMGFLGTKLAFSLDENILYVFNWTSDFYTISNLDNGIESAKLKKHTLLHDYYMHNFTDRYLNLMHRTKDQATGKDIMEVNVYDKKTCKYLFNISDHVIAFSMLNDRQNNLWVSTLHKGLYLYKTATQVKPLLQKNYGGLNFYSVVRSTDGTIFAGNERGEIIEVRNNVAKAHKVYTSGKIEWQRNIILASQKIFTFSDGGVVVNYNREILRKSGNPHQESKVVLKLNDSIILIGSNNGLSKLNILTEQIEDLNIGTKTILSIASNDGVNVYLGSTDGLYCYHTKNRSIRHLNKDIILKSRIAALCSTSDSLLWVATATNGIAVLKNDRVLKHISQKDGLSTNNSLVIVGGKKNEIWLGTNAGVSRIYYSHQAQDLSFRIQNISTIDGLSHQIINQLFYDRGNVYAATQKGLCVIPDSVSIPEIKVQLTGLKINQKDTNLLTNYVLKSNEKNVVMQFAAANLLGYFKHLDYSQDEGKTWTSLEDNSLRIEFSNGIHSIWVRAVDVNKNIGKDILKLSFDIAIPFWERAWFWILITLLINAIIAYLFYLKRLRKELERRKLELAKANLASLEQQAFTSLMNPHFMFNALNSIQHYINNQDRQNANRYLSDFASLIRKNFEAAQQAFIPLEQEMENISLYLRLEKMRFNEKFTFEIVYEDNLDQEDWMMPTMILQPLVENSILHGIMPSQIHCELLLKLSLFGQDLLLEVIDNGIGVENSRAMKQGSTHKSRGMELIHKRLKALNFFSKQTLELSYSVPYDDERNPGNKTSLLIPFDLYDAWRKVQKSSVEH